LHPRALRKAADHCVRSLTAYQPSRATVGAMYQQAVAMIVAVGLIAAAIMLTNRWALKTLGPGTPNSVLLDRCCIDRSRPTF